MELATITMHPSMFGLPSETVVVDRVTAAPGLEKAWQHNQSNGASL